MAKITIEFVKGNLGKVIEGVKRASRNRAPLYRNWGEHAINSTVQNFRSQGRPAWKPLAKSTVLSRLGGVGKTFTKKGKLRKRAARKMGGLKPLIKSGDLMRSINYRVRQNGIEYGSNLKYAAIHQFGGKAGVWAAQRSKRAMATIIPARPYLVVHDFDAAYYASSLEQHILGSR